MDPNEVVCYCLNITKGAIKDAIDAGSHTLEEVQEATGAGTVCGACQDDIKQLIEELS